MFRLTLFTILTLYLIQGSESSTAARMKRHTEDLRDHIVGKLSSVSSNLETALQLAKMTNYGGMISGWQEWQECKKMVYSLGDAERAILYAPVFASKVVTNFTEGVGNMINCTTFGVLDLVDCVFEQASNLKQMGLDTKTNAVSYGQNVSAIFGTIKDEFLKCTGHAPTTAAPTEAPTTEAPTSAPTDAPTPSPAPTDAPTPSPAPTDAPTPSPAPTDAPTPPPAPTSAPSQPSEVKALHNLLFKKWNHKKNHI